MAMEECSQGGKINKAKTFRDPIHGHIELPSLLVTIINTPQFQRLRHIKQLGAVDHVYPGATHSRFAHSIGVAHLAGEMVKYLRTKQRELSICDRDELCVQIAGLCHDLGHGPFSHVFDGMFFPKVKTPEQPNWKHENASVDMFEYMLRVNDLKKVFEEHHLTTSGEEDNDITFIKELINPPEKINDPSSWPCKGRKEDKSFLYEIVANKENGIDVDKWDYFERDCYYAGVPSNFDMRRTMKLICVLPQKWQLPSDDRRHICVYEKEVYNLYQMFHTRYSLHRRVYQHSVAKGVELMIRDALVAANDQFEISCSCEESDCPKTLHMSDAVTHMPAYAKLTDGVLQQILDYPSSKLHTVAQQIVERIQNRRFYKCVADEAYKLTKSCLSSEKETLCKCIAVQAELRLIMERCKELKHKTPEFEAEIAGACAEEGLTAQDIAVHVVTFDYGKKDANPIDHVWFYRKSTTPDKPVRITKDEVSPMLPEVFIEHRIRVYCKDAQNEGKVKKCFEQWWKKEQKSLSEKVKDRLSQCEKEQKPLDEAKESEASGQQCEATPERSSRHTGEKANNMEPRKLFK